MNHQSIHSQDISSFDLTSTHRLPTVSAAQALEDLGTDPQRFISTNLTYLDQNLNDVIVDNSSALPRPGGLQKGQVVEIWGPPGSGKTAFGIQLAANILRQGEKVIWVDGFHPISPRRLHDVIVSAQYPSSPSTTTPLIENQTDNFLHFRAPTLAHLIGLLCKPTSNAIPGNTSLIVIDTLSSLINHAYPRNFETRRPQKGPGPSARRLQVLQFLISTLQKLAATRDLCIVILSQCATRMQSERGATLIPAINAGTWEQGIATRLVLFRDWVMENDTVRDIRFVGVQKLNGKLIPGGISQVFAFNVQSGGLVGVDLDANQSSLPLSPSPRLKRKLSQTDFEVADSEGEDYGWEDEDESEMPSMPPQWQGSEDILLGRAEDDDAQTEEGSSDQSADLESGHTGTDGDDSS
ncbi:P-loop containing nucleoside triphosphate hydrolase protein [Annulohypoxylon truncatum]|uniref:P-loop containing nucleoside triphosphate hydrolase protein n=1 Tax=Annulohypoxylon truncatum TaxID=327061 RepID=UPI00200740CF|nr:P-loop containing nucleoside triphosphate hydrolase protein [Annulohypoxylon truncatum]KAI1204911.1 P-loop containing nucleoside triphosphate hydrolase protein [Annulohypoxylon truncatum]